jgi:hypothetical protein
MHVSLNIFGWLIALLELSRTIILTRKNAIRKEPVLWEAALSKYHMYKLDPPRGRWVSLLS